MPDMSKKLEPGVPSCLPPLPAGVPRNRLGLAQWLACARKPADGPRRRQPDLAAPFRHGAGQDGRELRHSGRAAVASRAARLAGDRAGPHRLGREGVAPADRHQRDLPAGVEREAGTWSRATRKTGCWPGDRGFGFRPKWCATMPWRSLARWSRGSAARRSSRTSRPACGKSWPEARARRLMCKTRARGSTAAASMFTASGRSRTRPWPPSTPPAARSARSSGREPTRRSRPSSS